MVVGTDEFQALGIMEAKARGLANLRFAITQHPLGGLKPDAVKQKAAGIVEAVRDGLVASSIPQPVPADG